MRQSQTQLVFHEQEVAGVSFGAMVESGRVILHMRNSSGRVSSVDLIGQAFALPCICYSEAGWQNSGSRSGPPGWAVCHDTVREPRMFLGQLHSDDVRLLTHEFGLHRDDFVSYHVAFENSIAGQALKEIMLKDPTRAALFRRKDASLDDWAERIVSEEPARPTHLLV